MSKLPPHDHRSQLVFEAREDEYAIRQLIQKVCPGHWKPGPESPWPYMTTPKATKGWKGAIELAAALIKGEQKRIGLVVDADENPRARWLSVRGRFQKEGVYLPNEPSSEVFPGRTAEQRIGVWMMPDNRSPGALEEFLVPLVGAENLLWWWSGEALTEAQRWGAGITGSGLLKSRFHSWLAWQKKRPGMPFGLAIESDVLDGRRPSTALDAFVAWFRELFPPDTPAPHPHDGSSPASTS